MSATSIGGGAWLPANQAMPMFGPVGISSADTALMDADQEEVQIIGHVVLAGGSGSKTFGTSSKIGWLPGASITFQATATLRVGLKKASVIDAANGPPARATIGTAAFNVYKDLTGGTDTITSTTWRTDTMSTNDGANVTVNHGDLVAICFCLSITANAQSVKVRGHSTTNTTSRPTVTLVTSGPTYAAQAVAPNIIITFDDGSFGWIDGSLVYSASSIGTNIGNGVIYANVTTLPVPVTIDAVAVMVTEAGTTNFDVGLWSDPNGTPTAMTNGTVSVDPQQLGSASHRIIMVTLPTAQAIAANTAFAYGAKQNSATNIAVGSIDFDATTDMQADGLDSSCFAATSTGGAAFSTLNSGKRRMMAWFRVMKFDNGASMGGGGCRVIGS